MAFCLRSLSILLAISLSVHGSLADPSTCPRLGVVYLVSGVRSQCPVWIERCSPEEVSGDKLNRELVYAKENAYYSILFHASWCPFSRKVQPVFDALSSMFPQINHVAVEESAAMPSVFSRYGVHSFPSILIANRTSRIRYHGPKDLDSLVRFYKEMTGFDPVAYLSIKEPSNSDMKISFKLQDGSLREIIKSEPYLTFSVVFICLKAFICFFPALISHIKALLVVYTIPLNMGIFGEQNHLLDRVLHLIDLKKLRNKLRVCNKTTRNFHKGAGNARVWASSLASVSLGESSSSRDL
ncbi:uncharacterized protein A4U43_C03F28370 [Asparagus officinalis]|uniref:Thioredoxin domain-containing protein n=1 Tax=Asparagus officinalis TaxID=4686 RepID=A0A5P1FGE6_ASPOF|nr:5'-adenylylsulfate reductase-like 5 isoform X2 [Asparagus officinalis]ONK76477.1 uncharacterized protein A4U43_C03F28370 [Asparagus officinalis]